MKLLEEGAASGLKVGVDCNSGEPNVPADQVTILLIIVACFQIRVFKKLPPPSLIFKFPCLKVSKKGDISLKMRGVRVFVYDV